MPIRRIITIVRDQFDTVQKKLGFHEKKETSATEGPVAKTATKEGDVDPVVETEDAPAEAKDTA